MRWPLRSVDKSRGSPDSSSSSSSLSAGARQVRPNGKEWRDVEAQSRPRPVWSGRSAGRDNARPSVSRSREEERARDGAEAEGRESERERERGRGFQGRGDCSGRAEREKLSNREPRSEQGWVNGCCVATVQFARRRVWRRSLDGVQQTPCSCRLVSLDCVMRRLPVCC